MYLGWNYINVIQSYYLGEKDRKAVWGEITPMKRTVFIKIHPTSEECMLLSKILPQIFKNNICHIRVISQLCLTDDRLNHLGLGIALGGVILGREATGHRPRRKASLQKVSSGKERAPESWPAFAFLTDDNQLGNALASHKSDRPRRKRFCKKCQEHHHQEQKVTLQLWSNLLKEKNLDNRWIPQEKENYSEQV